MYVVQATPTTRGIPLHECMYVCENHVIVLVSKVRASSGHVGVMCHNTDIRVYMTNLFNLHVGRLLLSKCGEIIAYAMDLSLGLRAGATT